LRPTGLFFSIVLGLFSGVFPYAQRTYRIKGVSDLAYCGYLYLLSSGEVQWLKNGKFLRVKRLNFSPQRMFCWKGKLVFSTRGGIVDLKGKTIKAYPSNPLKVYPMWGDLCLLYSDGVECLGGRRLRFPSEVILTGKNVVVGRNWFYNGKLYPLRPEVKYTSLKENLAWWDKKGLIFSPEPGRVCFSGACRQVKGQIKALGRLGDRVWVVLSVDRDSGKLIFLSGGVTPRLEEAFLPYEPALAVSNGVLLVVGGRLGPVEIYPPCLDLSFSLAGLPYNIAEKVIKADLDGNGEEDFVVLSRSRKGWSGITVIYSFLKDAKNRMEELLEKAREDKNQGRYQSALRCLEEALLISGYISLSTTREILRERAEVLDILKRRKILKGYLPFIILGTIFLVLLFIGTKFVGKSGS